MARKANSKGNAEFLEELIDRAKAFARANPDVVKVAAIVAIVAFFFTHGLPLWDEDYHQAFADTNSWFSVILKLILPFTNEPQSWGYSDHPAQALFYKIFGIFFGTWGTGFFLLKSLAYGGLSGLIFHRLRKLGVGRIPGFFTVGVFALSTNAMAALIQHSDFGPYAQIVLIATLFYALPQIEKGPSSTAVYKRGWKGLPKAFQRFLITFFCLVYFGTKLKGDVALAPIILLAYLAFFDREKAKVYAAPFGITLFFTLPFSTSFFSHLPPFLPGAAGYTGLTYAPFSISRVFEFMLGGFFQLGNAPISVLGAAGVLVTLGAVAYGIYRASRENLEAPGSTWGFFLVWLGVALLALGVTPAAAGSLELRYTLVALVPAVFLLGMVLQAAHREFAKVKYFKEAVAALIVLQCGLHLFHDVKERKVLGHTMVAADRIFNAVEQNHPNGTLLFMPGYLNYSYKPSHAPAIFNRSPIPNADGAVQYGAGRTFVASWSSTLDPRFAVDTVASGCATSLFDALFPCTPMDGAVLLKYVGDVPELAQAQSLERQGNLNGARDVLESYLKREPNNHGVLFALGMYTYKTHDLARNEQIYDQLGPFFMNHPSVMYNWGLAKQGVEKFKEATKYLELAYSMVPKDYAIGFNLADSYYKVGKKSRALATLGELMQRYPNDQTMKNVYSDWSKK